MLGIIFTICVSVGLPLLAFVYACIKKQSTSFLLGALAFVFSQVLIRIPILQYLQDNNTNYMAFSENNPVLFALIIMGLSAGIFEEFARYFMMTFFMKHRDWRSGFLFGMGHGGIEAILLVGISALFILVSSPSDTFDMYLFVGGIERLFAILLHIGLSIMVLQGIVQRKFFYIILAIIIHALVNTLIGVLPLIIPPNFELISQEVSLAMISLVTFGYSLSLKRRGVLR